MPSAYQNKTFATYWNKRAGENGEVYKQYVLDPIMLNLESLQHKTVLELGCGNGYLAKEFLKREVDSLILMDMSKHNLTFAKQKVQSKNIQYLHHDATKKWKIKPNTIDVIYSNMMLNEVANIQTPIQEAFRVLKKHGAFIFSVTHPAWDLYVYAQEQAGITSQKIKNLGNYFREGYAQYVMGHDSKTNPALAKEFGKEFNVEHYQRPLSSYYNTLISAGFTVKKIIEPQLTKELLKANPRFISYKDHPIGLIFYCKK